MSEILFCSTSEVFNIPLENYPVRLQITRYTKKGLLTGFIHTPGLSPSESLLNKTNHKWKKLSFTDLEKQKTSEGETKTWWDLYKEEFEKEMQERNDFIANYNRLKQVLLEGKNIIACCYCIDYNKCHRALIAKKLEEEGFTVILK